jgi:hypothetical protein
MPIRASDRTAQPAARVIAERIAAGLESELPKGKIETVWAMGMGSHGSGRESDDVFTVVDRPGLGAFLRHPIRNSANTLAGVYDFVGEPDRNIMVVAPRENFARVRHLAQAAAHELNLSVDVFEGTPKPSRKYS